MLLWGWHWLWWDCAVDTSLWQNILSLYLMKLKRVAPVLKVQQTGYDPRFEFPPEEVPYGSIALAVFLTVFGATSLVLAWLHFTQQIFGKEQAVSIKSKRACQPRSGPSLPAYELGVMAVTATVHAAKVIMTGHWHTFMV